MIFMMVLMLGFVMVALVLAVRGAGMQPIAPSRKDHMLGIYQDQMMEIDRDLNIGLIDAQAAVSAKIEIKRRMLAVKDQTRGQGGLATAPALIFIVLFIPVFAFGMYFQIGAPQIPSQPIASRQAEIAQLTAITQSAARLQASLESAPDGGDIKDWLLLAQIYTSLGDYGLVARALDAVVKGFERGFENFENGEFGVDITDEARAQILANYAEALIRSTDGGGASNKAKQALNAAIILDPNNAKALHYLNNLNN